MVSSVALEACKQRKRVDLHAKVRNARTLASTRLSYHEIEHDGSGNKTPKEASSEAVAKHTDRQSDAVASNFFSASGPNTRSATYCKEQDLESSSSAGEDGRSVAATSTASGTTTFRCGVVGFTVIRRRAAHREHYISAWGRVHWVCKPDPSRCDIGAEVVRCHNLCKAGRWYVERTGAVPCTFSAVGSCAIDLTGSWRWSRATAWHPIAQRLSPCRGAGAQDNDGQQPMRQRPQSPDPPPGSCALRSTADILMAAVTAATCGVHAGVTVPESGASLPATANSRLS